MASYYDIDAILTDSQKVPCTFDLDVPGLGFVDNNAGGDVRKGTQVALPLWLGGFLALQRFGATSVLSIDLPASLAPRVLNALKANPRTVDLRTLATHFYSLAALSLELFEEDAIAQVLLETFKARASEISDHAHNPQGSVGDSVEFLRGLDEMERQLFRASHESSKSIRVWLGEQKKKQKGA